MKPNDIIKQHFIGKAYVPHSYAFDKSKTGQVIVDVHTGTFEGRGPYIWLIFEDKSELMFSLNDNIQVREVS